MFTFLNLVGINDHFLWYIIITSLTPVPLIFKMLSFKVGLFCLLILNALGNVVEKEEACVNNSDVLWNSLNFWNGVNLLKKWNKNEIENLSEICKSELGGMIEGLRNNSVWAIKMLDASGHYSGSIFNGNEFWMGSNTQCQNLQSHFNQITISNLSATNEGQFYLRTQENRLVTLNNKINIHSVPPFSVRYSVTKIIFKMNLFCKLSNETESAVNIGLCLPSSCSAPDVRKTLEWAINKNVIDIKTSKFIPGDYNVWEDKRFYFLCTTFFLITFLVTLGTILEYMDSLGTYKISTTIWYRILHAFSLISNWRSIGSQDVGEDTLAPIHGLKFISMMWVVLVHTCLMLFQVAANKKIRDHSETNVLYQTLSNATYAVDTFFTISGTLVSFLFFRTVAKYSVKRLIGIDGITGHVLMHISMVFYRLIRLSLPYFIMVVVTGFLAEQQMNNAPLFLINKDHINCVNYWWRNALYINTFYAAPDMCMSWSWYLANDTQFFVLGVPLLLLALHYRNTSLTLGSILVISSWITTAFMAYQTHHVVDIRDPFAHYDELYNKPWTRLGPYFIGLFTGWYLYNISCSLKMPKKVNISLWAFALGCMTFVLYGPMYFPLNETIGIIYTSLAHTVWSAGVAWVLMACVTNNGFWINDILSWKYLYPLSRLSYCAYLVHPVVIRMMLLNSDSTYFITPELMSVLFFGFLVLSLLFGAILSLAFESPVVALLRLGHPIRKNKQDKE